MRCCQSSSPRRSPRVMVKYIGHDPVFKITGPMTLRVYRFRGHGFKLEMDALDWITIDRENLVVEK